MFMDWKTQHCYYINYSNLSMLSQENKAIYFIEFGKLILKLIWKVKVPEYLTQH